MKKQSSKTVRKRSASRLPMREFPLDMDGEAVNLRHKMTKWEDCI